MVSSRYDKRRKRGPLERTTVIGPSIAVAAVSVVQVVRMFGAK